MMEEDDLRFARDVFEQAKRANEGARNRLRERVEELTAERDELRAAHKKALELAHDLADGPLPEPGNRYVVDVEDEGGGDVAVTLCRRDVAGRWIMLRRYVDGDGARKHYVIRYDEIAELLNAGEAAREAAGVESVEELAEWARLRRREVCWLHQLHQLLGEVEASLGLGGLLPEEPPGACKMLRQRAELLEERVHELRSQRRGSEARRAGLSARAAGRADGTSP